MVQMIYHEAVTNAPQWNASFCYPEGFIRWWAQPSQAGNFQLTMTTVAGPVPVGHRGQLPAPGDDRQGARAEGPAVVRRDHRILGRHDAGHLDGEHSGLDAVARDVRYERQDGDRGDLQARATTPAASSSGSITRRSSTIPRRSSRRCARRFASPGVATPDDPDSPVHLHRVPEQHPQHRWPAEAADRRRPALHRLLRPAVGQELGEVLRSRAGTSRRTNFPRRSPTSSNRGAAMNACTQSKP